MSFLKTGMIFYSLQAPTAVPETSQELSKCFKKKLKKIISAVFLLGRILTKATKSRWDLHYLSKGPLGPKSSWEMRGIKCSGVFA